MKPLTEPLVTSNLVAEILVSHSGRDSIFSYAVPQEIAAILTVGHIVKVPLRKGFVNGVVWSIATLDRTKTRKYALKPVKGIVHPDLKLLPYQKELAEWMSREFIAPLSACVFSFLPVIKTPPKVVAEEERIASQSAVTLTDEQTKALQTIESNSKPILLHGITGSGKTEVYLRYAQEVLDQGKDVLILVPEIALTPQTRKRFVERFGNIVSLWHSELSVAERRQDYWAVRYGKKRLIVGSRSALFLPYTNLGLIVIDEEHEKTYSQESSPRYNAITVAEHVNEQHAVKLVLGSATPRLESVWKASTGEYALARLEKRPTESPLPEAVIIDLRQEKLLEGSNISHSMFLYLEETLAKKRQAVVLLNRRGHSTAAQCTTCGALLMCRNCNVPMTTHITSATYTHPTLQCHHCDRHEVAPIVCPVCEAPTLTYKGFGTERVETELQKLLPTARILRMDRDTTSSRDIVDQMYHDFADHKYDILLGTQMIAKGWDIASVDMVGVLLAESGLMLPDYHSAANTFNLLVQVSGRSGRGKNPGLTVIQTYQPDNPLIRAAALHDFGIFAKTELKSRRQFNYPPFSHVIRLLYQHAQEEKCTEETTKLAEALHKRYENQGVEILGPAPCFFERLRGKHRHHIILKVIDTSLLSDIAEYIRPLKSPWVIEQDPGQLL